MNVYNSRQYFQRCFLMAIPRKKKKSFPVRITQAIFGLQTLLQTQPLAVLRRMCYILLPIGGIYLYMGPYNDAWYRRWVHRCFQCVAFEFYSLLRQLMDGERLASGKISSTSNLHYKHDSDRSRSWSWPVLAAYRWLWYETVFSHVSLVVLTFLIPPCRQPPIQHRTMAGEPELTGMAKHFNSSTFTGRANVAKVRHNTQSAFRLVLSTTMSN